MNRNRQKNNFPILRRSVALITTAILLSASAHAEIEIPRLSSLGNSNSSESSVSVKPNVFLVIDNGKNMTGSDKEAFGDPDGNYLQQTAGALIAALPQLEGKVRLGYTTIYPGVRAIDDFAGEQGRFGKATGSQKTCKYFKLNGNVDRLDPFIPGLKKDLAKNLNYVTGQEDFVFNEFGSGYGNTVPRDFRDNYARYIYAWLGAMCMGNSQDGAPTAQKPDSTKDNRKTPPYADLRDKNAYKTAASATGNINSFPLVNFYGVNVFPENHKPLLDMYLRILGQVSDEDFICSLLQNKSGGSRCIYTDLSAERGSRGNTTLRNYPEGNRGVWKYFSYDAYAPAREDTGFPDDKDPVSCRKNYTIMISHGAYAAPAAKTKSNTNVGVGDRGISGAGGYNPWRMPNGRDLPTSGKLGELTRMYRFLPNELEGVIEIPSSSYRYYSGPRTPLRKNMQGAGGSFLLSKLILRGYYEDLRENLPNDVSPYIAGPIRKQGPNGMPIHPFWDRKNDPAPWQHMGFFALGFTKEMTNKETPNPGLGQDDDSSFASWLYANRAYKNNYSDLDPDGGLLEPYFRAIEDGTIYNANKPLYDWGRGGFGLKSLSPALKPEKGGDPIPPNLYIYKGSETVSSGPPDPWNNPFEQARSALLDMDYAKAGIIGRGGAYQINDYKSIKKVIDMIAKRIEKASANIQGISGGAVGGGGRITATGGNDSTLFATYLDQSNYSGNIFAFKNCPLLQQSDEKWVEEKCGSRLWDAASILAKPSIDIASKTIVPILEGSNQLVGQSFIWENLDSELKAQFSGSEGEKVGQARVNWLNGTLASSVNDTAVKGKLRERPKVKVPSENNSNGNNASGAVKETKITNLMGEIVYATPKAVDNRGTLPAAHPLNGASYRNFVDNVVSERAPMVVAGSNDGRLYAFNNLESPSLAFSYIPRYVMTRAKDSLNQYISQDVTAGHMGFVNGPFSYRDAFVGGKWGTYLVGTLGTGGGVIYALDISKGTANHPEDVFKWETADKFGTIMTEPRIIWIRNTKKDCGSQDTSCSQGKWVVLVPTGYNADSVSLVILDLENGQELARIDTHSKYRGDKGTGTCTLDDAQSGLEKTLNVPTSVACDNGLGALTVVDADLDGGADYVYAGDLLGHVWKFDLTGFFKTENPGEGVKVAYNGQPIFIAETADGATRQPITAMIEVADGAYGEGSMLYFGTGRLFNLQERGLAQQQSFYGVWDNPRYVNKSDINSDATGYNLPLRRTPPSSAIYDFIKYDTFLADKSKIQNNNVLRFFSEIRGVKPKGGASPSSDYLSLGLDAKGSSANKGAVGWIIDFSETPKERVIGRAYSFEGSVFFPTFEPKGDTGGAQESCTPPVKSEVGGDGRFYMVDRLTGGQLDKSPFDFNGDGQQDDDDNIKEFQPVHSSNGSNSNGSDDGAIGSLPPAAIKLGSTSGNFLSVTGVLSMIEKSKKDHQCDYTRQVIFPGTVDPVHGNPTVFTSCHQNRYRVWKQPIIE